MTNRLENKVCLVTGAGSGIGKAIAIEYAKQGAKVVVTDIDLDAIASIVEDICAQHGAKAIALQQDVCDPEQWEKVLSSTLSEFGEIDVLVNNAGIVIPGTVEDTTLADWRKTQEVNVEGTFLGSQSCIKKMKEKGGSIINISSIEGIVGEPNTAAYNASKGAVRIFTKSTALHCTSQGYGIRVNSVHPGFIDTPLVRNALASVSPEEAVVIHGRILAGIPLGKMGTPEDVAHACVYLVPILKR